MIESLDGKVQIICDSCPATFGAPLADRQANTHLKVNAIMQIIEKTAFIENVLAASMSPGMAASLDWSRGVQTRALTH